MRNLALAISLLAVTAACSDSTGTEISVDCSTIPGSIWESVEELTGGEAPGGDGPLEQWVVEFRETDVTWSHTDTVVTRSYRCSDGVLTAGESTHDFDPAILDIGDGTLRLRWRGDLYKRIEGFVELP